MKNKTFVIVFLVIIFALGIFLYMNNPEATHYGATPKTPSSPDNGVVCTMEAKLCPDGSYVGRIPPKCEFKACPIPQDVKMEDGTVDKGEIPY